MQLARQRSMFAIMESEQIKEVGIDAEGKLFIKPLTQEYPFIYRAAMGVYWDDKNHYLYSPILSESKDFDWFQQMLDAVRSEYQHRLLLTESTTWVNVPDDVKNKISATIR